MGILDDIFGNDDEAKAVNRDDNGKLQLRKEVLDIHKNSIHTGEVELGKEIVSEEKAVDVPVTREEVVIERRRVDEQSDSPITNEESIRIPVSEETVDVDKHTIVTEEVSAHKRNIEDTRHIDETLKREEARVNTIGDADVVDSEIRDHD